jgi:hypothetical protein
MREEIQRDASRSKACRGARVLGLRRMGAVRLKELEATEQQDVIRIKMDRFGILARCMELQT